MRTKSFVLALTIAVSALLASCGSTTAPTTYTISGTVTGLNGTGLVLQYNSGNNLTISSNGPFTFSNAILSGSTYTVSVLTQPTNPAQTCTIVSGASGTANSDIVTVNVGCANNTFTLGGTVSGLSGTGLVLQNNGGSNLSIGSNGSFQFSGAINNGSNYNVTVATQPSNPAQICNVTNGVGTNVSGNVTSILVTCFTTTVTYTIGGRVAGLAGSGLVLQDNSGDNLPVSANGNFTFATPLPSGATYSVTVLTQPSSATQNCVVAAGSGTANASITGIVITCAAVPFSVGGTISSLTGSGLVLQDNGGNNLAVAANSTSFSFTTPVASGSTYAATVLTQPTGTPCAVTGGSGTVGNGPVSSISIDCSGSKFNVSATVSGLPANTSVVLQDNGGDNLTVTTNGVVTNFNTPIANNSAYAVTVLTQPAGATCTAGANASGTISGANVNVAVTCGDPIVSGNEHACAITSSGGVVCWGANEHGQLGDGTTKARSNPVSVVGISGQVVSLAAGATSTCALTSDGNAWCWGDNSSGQLGDGSFTDSSVAVAVLNLDGDGALSGVTAISAGADHACAVTDQGAALCWGDNSSGELGNGDYLSSNVPVPVSGLSSGVSTVSAGAYFTCAVTASEAALCWGKGSAGQLGGENAESSSAPVAVMDAAGKSALSGVVAIAAGSENACAITTGATALCWGANDFGQLGNGTTGAPSSVPVSVLNPDGKAVLANVVSIKGGVDNFCAVTASGTALCWGLTQEAEMSAATAAGAGLPAPVSVLPNDIMAIAVGREQSCALTNSGAALCWKFVSGQSASGDSSASPIE